MAPKSSPSQHTHMRFLRCLDWKIKAKIKENIKKGKFWMARNFSGGSDKAERCYYD